MRPATTCGSTDNLFLDDGWGDGQGQGSNNGGAVDINSSGGFNIPGSRYEKSISVSSNYFINDWQGVDIWQSGQRSCESSGEGWPVDASYCSGGFPNTATTAADGQYYFSHIGDSKHGGATIRWHNLFRPAARLFWSRALKR